MVGIGVRTRGKGSRICHTDAKKQNLYINLSEVKIK